MAIYKKQALRIAGLVLVANIVWFTSLPADAQTKAAVPIADAVGNAIYARECAMCHGDQGDGSGPGSHMVNPKPRDFTLSVFKFRSTPSGQPPTDSDLFKIITNGVTGTAMPSFQELSENERWALVAVVKQFAGIQKSGTAVKVPAEPAASSGSVAKGRQVYSKLKCAECHGGGGEADGSSSLTLKDDAKHRIWAADLTRGRFKGGSTSQDLYLRIHTGIDGSPMPSYAAEATPAEIWALVHYVRSLSITSRASRKR